MKITKLSVQNFLGISAVTIEPKRPIVVVAAPNGAGKTSLYQAIKLALLDVLPRVELKREAAELVRGGAGKGSVQVETDTGLFNVALPSRARNGDPIDGYAGFCLDPWVFAQMDPASRSRVVLNLSKVRMDKDAIAGRLVAHGVPEQIVDELDPLLVLGFEKCAAHAKEQASEHRGGWKQITGETYGSVKAATWKPAATAELPDAPESMEGAVKRHAEATAALAGLEAARVQHAEWKARFDADTALAPKVASLRALVDDLKRTANADEEHHFPACPHCGGLIQINLAGGLEKADPKPGPKVKPAIKAKAARELATAQRELTAAEAAAARLADATGPGANPTDEEIQKAKDALAQATDLLGSVSRAQSAYAEAVARRRGLEEQAENAIREHAWVEGWEKAATALSPTGIPSELMTQAMAPMRAAIKAVCASEYISDWPLPELANDGGISAWGRPYPMLSESEQYRVDVILSAAIANLCGLKFIAMDRADVLSPAVRGELIGWLWDMVEDGTLEQAWVFVTLKAPLAPQGETVEAHWLEAGAMVPA